MLTSYRFPTALFFVLGLMLALFACDNDAPSGNASTPQDAANPQAGQQVNRPLQHLLDEYLQPYPDELTAKSSVEEDTAVFRAMEAYNAGRFTEAIELFPNSATSMEQAGYIRLYKAVSQLLAGMDHDAFTALGRMRSNMGKAFEISEWYMALNYVAFNNVFEARKKLEKIIADGTYGTEQAKELLEDLPEKK